MIAEPPGEPVDNSSFLLSLSNTKVGAIELRGRLPGCTRFEIGPFASATSKEKSVNWLLSKKPSTIWREPNASSIVVVIEIALPLASTIEMCDVEGNSGEVSKPHATLIAGGVPNLAGPIDLSVINAARSAKYFLSNNGLMLLPGSGTKSVSAT